MKKRFGHQHGFTLIELIIGMTISLLAAMAIYAVFESQHEAMSRIESKADLNLSMRSSFDILTKHARMAGFGVESADALGPINNFAATGGFAPAVGFLGSTTLGPSLTANIKNATDAVLIIHADNEDCTNTGNETDSATANLFHNATNGTAKVCEPNCFSEGTYQTGDVLLVKGQRTGGIDSTFFVKVNSITINQAATSKCSGGTSDIGYVNVDELNLPLKYNCSTVDPCVNQFASRLDTAYVYYVNNSDELVRTPIDTTFSMEVVTEGVEDLQIPIRFDLRV